MNIKAAQPVDARKVLRLVRFRVGRSLERCSQVLDDMDSPMRERRLALARRMAALSSEIADLQRSYRIVASIPIDAGGAAECVEATCKLLSGTMRALMAQHEEWRLRLGPG